MEPRNRSPIGAYELRLTDVDLAHLRIVITAEVSSTKWVLPLEYWRRRVVRLLSTRKLMPAQIAVASALLTQIDAETESAPPLAKAS
jgi:hypothetical protein